MELTVWYDDLREERQDYNNRFELKISDFTPDVQKAIERVHISGGRVIYREFGNPGNYVAITE